MADASITLDAGKGLSGSSCNPTPSHNPVMVFGEPFGHAFEADLYTLIDDCGDCSVYLPTTSYDVSSLSCQHEIVFAYYRIYPGTELINGHTYTVKITWKKGAATIFYLDYNFTWDTTWDYYHGFAYIGWTPCWWWAFGSMYDGNEEIKENGSDYLIQVELYDGSTQLCYDTQSFTISNLQHTVIYWDHIQDYTGADIGGYFGMKASEYVHDLGSDVWDTQWYRKKNLSSAGTLKVDGMEGTVDLQAYRSGYVKQVRSCDSVTDKDTKGPYDFDGDDYLPASVEGHVMEGSDFVSNVNVWGERSGAKYGCKSNSNGLYALPLHTGGTYTIKAVKNNHDVITRGSTIAQTDDHPSSRVLWEFTLSRITDYPQGAYAHLNSLAADNQSVIIPDDPVTGAGTPNQSDSVGATVVKVKTHKWGDGTAQCTTSTGTSNGGSAYGSGGFDYNGDMGEAEGWSEEPPP